MPSSDVGIDIQVPNLVVRRGVTTVTVDGRNDCVEVFECFVPTRSLCGHLQTEIASRPLPIRVLQQANFSVRIVRPSRIGTRHMISYSTKMQNPSGGDALWNLI